MLEYGLLSGMTGSLSNALSGTLDLVMRAGSDLLDLVADHPFIALGFALLLVALGRFKARSGR